MGVVIGNFTGNYTDISQFYTDLSNIHLIKNDVLNSVILFFLIIALSFVIAKIVYFIIETVVTALTRKTKTKIDDIIVEKTKTPFYFLVIFYGIRVALYPLIIPIAIEKILVSITYSLIIATVMVIIAKSANVIIDEWGKNFAKKTKSDLDDSLLSLFHKFINIFFIIVTGIFILNQWGIEVGPFVASLGVASIVLGLALQSTIANIFGGIQLILDQSFKVGDVVKVGTDIFGTVKDIGIRSTRISTFDNELLIVPNGQLSNMVVQNLALPDLKARVVVDFGVEYGSDPDKVKEVIEKELLKMKEVLNPAKVPDTYISVVFVQMADFSLNFQARFWVDHYSKRFDAKVAATNLIYNTLRKNKIGIPFPTRTIYMKKEE